MKACCQVKSFNQIFNFEASVDKSQEQLHVPVKYKI